MSKKRNRNHLKSATDNHSYMTLFRDNLSCPICRPNKGCNRKRSKDLQNWKSNRSVQWKEVIHEC